MSAAKKPLLAIERLRIEAARGAVLVDDVSLTLRRGEVLGLIGESGAGKSTIGLAALGYARTGCRIAGGRILLDGTDIVQLPLHERRRLRGNRIAYIAQSAAAAFDPSMRIIAQVTQVLRLQGTPRDVARVVAIRLFEELGLPDPTHFGDRFPHQVSGGQLQRATAAMAMAAKPDILVFDEPTTALDVTTQVGVLAAFRRLVREHEAAALYITHDLPVVAQMADRIMVLRRGKMVEIGTTTEILDAPREDYTRKLVASLGEARRPTTPAEPAPLLSLQNVVAGYRTLPRAIDDVSLDLGPRETVAIVGESGSGKSTLARIVVGLLPRGQGDVRFRGTSLPPRLRDRSKDILRRIQLVSQIPDVALNPRRTVGDIIGRPVRFYFGRSPAAVRARVRELLELIDLPQEFARRLPGQLSGGQKQRVSIARALAAEPDIVICDEVTAALDQLVADDILALLQRLQRELSVAYLFITHDLGLVRRVADKVVVLRKGAVVASGVTTDVFAAPSDDYTRRLLASVPQMRQGWLDEALQTASA